MSVRWSISDTFETDDQSCCSELPESKDGNASGVHEGLNAQAMYMNFDQISMKYSPLDVAQLSLIDPIFFTPFWPF